MWRIRVAERLIGTVRASDTVVRLGGDEFAVLMEGEVEASYAVAQRVVTAFERSFSIDGQCLRVRPSVGRRSSMSGKVSLRPRSMPLFIRTS